MIIGTRISFSTFEKSKHLPWELYVSITDTIERRNKKKRD